jgi:hypothetical protein
LWTEKKKKKNSNNKKIPNQKGFRRCCRGTVFYWEVKIRDAPKSIKREEEQEEDCVSRD